MQATAHPPSAAHQCAAVATSFCDSTISFADLTPPPWARAKWNLHKGEAFPHLYGPLRCARKSIADSPGEGGRLFSRPRSLLRDLIGGYITRGLEFFLHRRFALSRQSTAHAASQALINDAKGKGGHLVHDIAGVSYRPLALHREKSGIDGIIRARLDPSPHDSRKRLLGTMKVDGVDGTTPAASS